MVLAKGCYVYVCTKFEAAISFGLKVIRGPKISKLVHVT